MMTKWFLLIIFFNLLFFTFDSPAQAACDSMGPLTVSSQNPRYFENPCGEEVYLTGSHTWQMPFGTNYDFSGKLNQLHSWGHTYVRLWAWESDTTDEPASVFMPYSYSNGRYNLDSWNNQYFSTLLNRVREAANYNMYVSVMFFQGWTVHNAAGLDLHSGHPYRSGNNSNGLNVTMNGNGETHDLNNSQVLTRQKQFVDKIVDTLQDEQNVIYEISNESYESSSSWQNTIISYLKNDLGVNAPVGKTSYYHDICNNSSLINSQADWVSPHSYNCNTYRDNMPATTGNKVFFLDTDHVTGTYAIGPDWIWKSFVRGYYPLFMDRANFPVGNDGSHIAQGQTADAASRIDLGLATPSSSSYLLQSTNNFYIRYMGAGGSLAVPSGNYDVFEYKYGNLSPNFRTVSGVSNISCTSSCIGLLALKTGASATPSPTRPPTSTATPAPSPTPAVTTCNNGIGPFTECASENWPNIPGNCVFSGLSEILYGTLEQYRCMVSTNSPVVCSESVFGGDPAPGTDKKCYVRKVFSILDLLRSYGLTGNYDLTSDGLVNTLDFAFAIHNN